MKDAFSNVFREALDYFNREVQEWDWDLAIEKQRGTPHYYRGSPDYSFLPVGVDIPSGGKGAGIGKRILNKLLKLYR